MDYGNGYGYDQQPQVVINQAIPGSGYQGEDYDRPTPSNRAYTRPPNDSTDYKPALYLIAFKDHTTLAVLSYWVDGNTLHTMLPRTQLLLAPGSRMEVLVKGAASGAH